MQQECARAQAYVFLANDLHHWQTRAVHFKTFFFFSCCSHTQVFFAGFLETCSSRRRSPSPLGAHEGRRVRAPVLLTAGKKQLQPLGLGGTRTLPNADVAFCWFKADFPGEVVVLNGAELCRLKAALHSHTVGLPAARSRLEVKKGEQHHPLG